MSPKKSALVADLEKAQEKEATPGKKNKQGVFFLFLILSFLYKEKYIKLHSCDFNYEEVGCIFCTIRDFIL